MQLVCEIGDVRRFESPTALMAYLGFVPSQHSSGNTIRTGSITKTGNTHARKVLVSAAWKYIYAPRIRVALQKRQKHCSANVIAITQKAQTRLYKRYNANLRKSRWLRSCVNWLAFSGRRCKLLLKQHKQPIRYTVIEKESNATMESPSPSFSVAMIASPSFKILVAPTYSNIGHYGFCLACVHQIDIPSPLLKDSFSMTICLTL